MVKFIKALFTDGEWDGDATKVFGLMLMVAGVVGWFMGKDPAIVIGTGAALAASGKFSAKG